MVNALSIILNTKKELFSSLEVIQEYVYQGQLSN